MHAVPLDLAADEVQPREAGEPVDVLVAVVDGLLKTPLGTVKTRLRDGLIRMRDCLGVDW